MVASTKKILVTGAFGLVGRAVLDRLTADGFDVVATDLDTPGNRKLAKRRSGAESAGRLHTTYADLTDATAVRALLTEHAPDVIVHLAAVIPPACYAHPALAQRVNVDAVAHLVEVAEELPSPPRLVFASSVATYGSRNPHRDAGPVTAATPVAPSDLYGRQKVAAEGLIRESSLDWAILRLGGVMTADVGGTDADTSWFSSLLPDDGRIHTVDVRDVARAFAAASVRPVTGETFLIGGDKTHRLAQREIGLGYTAAMGLDGAVPAGRNGDPADDSSWFATDWMDTDAAQAALEFQTVSWPDLLAEIRERTGAKRYLLRLLAPILAEVARRKSPYRHHPREYADPWTLIAQRYPDLP
ncbi:NAD-dependent epimerase/dehydratase family protein [Nocardioides limicola]|uniref:NAD-dependent epimerase/dehydratase family protein n=1 Tax=Nocardioides limicola TaxID=2803368 RepID=UPI00193B9696|nr:NAD(P)-dependent oxidoreductase [Nocardioides sp. DJM-14]